MIKQKSFFVFQTVLGALLFFFAIFALLRQFGVSSFLPLEFTSQSFLEVVLMLVGVFFLREAVRHKNSGQRIAHFVVGLSLFLVAVFPLFVSLGILKVLPYYIDLTVNSLLLSFLVLLGAVFMILDRIFLFIS